MHAYCLFCNTSKCGEVADAIRRSLGHQVIAPKIVQRKWIKGTPTEAIHDLLPGYVFIYTAEPIVDFLPILRMQEVYRILGEKDYGYRLTGSDYSFAETLLEKDGTIGILKVYRVGERVKLARGMLGDVEGEIIRLDRRGRAQVQFFFDSIAYKIWVGYEMIAPETENAGRGPDGEGGK